MFAIKIPSIKKAGLEKKYFFVLIASYLLIVVCEFFCQNKCGLGCDRDVRLVFSPFSDCNICTIVPDQDHKFWRGKKTLAVFAGFTYFFLVDFF